MDPFGIQELRLSLYVLVNWAFTLGTAVWLAALFRQRRHLFLKPSMVVISYAHLLLQWPAALNASYFERFLPDPYSLVLAVHGAVLLALAVSANTHDALARRLWDRMLAARGDFGTVAQRATIMLVITAAAVITWYLWEVPFSETGLYAIFETPLLAAIARENSLKLLENRTLAYAFLAMASAVAPLLTVLLLLGIRPAVRARRPLAVMGYVACFLGLAVGVSLTGARSFSVNLVAVIAIALMLLNGLPFRPLKILAGVALILAPAVLLTVFREGQSLNLRIVIDYLFQGVIQRAFVAPLEVGAWYLHYSQVHDLFGIAAIPKLAGWLGARVIDVPNLIGLVYSPYANGVSSVSAGGSYLLTYFSYFGTFALLLTAPAICLTDLLLAAYDRVDVELLLPCIAAGSLAALAFISADYTTVWLSHGFGIIPLLALAAGRLAGGARAAAGSGRLAISAAAP